MSGQEPTLLQSVRFSGDHHSKLHLKKALGKKREGEKPNSISETRQYI